MNVLLLRMKAESQWVVVVMDITLNPFGDIRHKLLFQDEIWEWCNSFGAPSRVNQQSCPIFTLTCPYALSVSCQLNGMRGITKNTTKKKWEVDTTISTFLALHSCLEQWHNESGNTFDNIFFVFLVMTLISFSYQETLRAYGCARARGEIGYANKWYQGDMITGRLPLSEQRRHTKGGGENFPNQAKSLTQKATTSSRVSPPQHNDLRTLSSSKRAMTMKERAVYGSPSLRRAEYLWIAAPAAPETTL